MDPVRSVGSRNVGQRPRSMQCFRASRRNNKIGFGVFNLVSNNEASRWDLTDLQRDLGYQPLDGTRPSVGPVGKAKTAVAYFRDDFVPALLRKTPGRTW